MDARLLRDERPMEIERPRGTEQSWMASTSDDDREKVDCIRIMKEIPNGAENTGDSPLVLSSLFSPLFLPGRNDAIVTGLESFAAAVGSTR